MGLPNKPVDKLNGSITSSTGGGTPESVKVVVRCRPLSQMEVGQGHTSIVSMDTTRGVVEVRNAKEPRLPAKCFTFDAIYDQNSRQADLYDETFRELVDSVLRGFNGTIFAYGQTGTGKTFTMEGVRENAELRGVIPNAIDHIFGHIAQSKGQEYLVRASYLEIYQEEIRDLLDKDSHKRLELKERPDIGVYVKDLSSFVTKSIEEIEHIMEVGNANRSVGQTKMNEHSSRSHAIFVITVECSEVGLDGGNHIRVGRLNLVDLAGSERQSKSGTTGEAFKEATRINLSLSALNNVIAALVDPKSGHVPYRDSKLTRLLQDSLGGNARSIMCANIGPASYNFDETLSTLRYASRAKAIKNRPKINEDPKDALLREFQEEIERLRQLLEKKTSGGGGGRRRRGTAGGGEVEGARLNSPLLLNEDDLIKKQQLRLDAEREAVLRNREMLDEEKGRILQQLEERAIQLEKEREAQEAVAAKIRTMQSKLLTGDDTSSSSILSQTQEQQRLLQLRRMEVVEQRRREREMAQQLEAQEDGAAEIRQTFANLQQEVEAKTAKLNKFVARLQQIRAEIGDLSEANFKERSALEASVYEMNKELRLKWLLIDNFIPAELVERIKSSAYFSEDEEKWIVPRLATTQQQQQQEGAPRPKSSGRDLTDSSFVEGALKQQTSLKAAVPSPNNGGGGSASSSIMASVSGSGGGQQEETMIDSGLGTSDVSSTSQESTTRSPTSARLRLPKRPVSMAGLHRPMCNYERQQLARLRQRALRSASTAPKQSTTPACYVPEEVARFCYENLLTFDSLIGRQSKVIRQGEEEEEGAISSARGASPAQSVVVDVSRIPVPSSRSRSGSAARRKASAASLGVKPSKNGQAHNVHGGGSAASERSAKGASHPPPPSRPSSSASRPPSASLHFPKARGLVGGGPGGGGGGAGIGRRQ